MCEISMGWLNLHHVSPEFGQKQASDRSHAQAGDVQYPHGCQLTGAVLHQGRGRRWAGEPAQWHQRHCLSDLMTPRHHPSVEELLALCCCILQRCEDGARGIAQCWWAALDHRAKRGKIPGIFDGCERAL